MKTTILPTLRNYYGQMLKDALHAARDLEPPPQHHLQAYQSVREGKANDGRVTREHSSGAVVTVPFGAGNSTSNYKTSAPFGSGNGPSVTINRKNNPSVSQQKSLSVARVAPNSTMSVTAKKVSASTSANGAFLNSTNPSGGGNSDKGKKSDHDLLKNISEKNSSRSESRGSLGRNLNNGTGRRSPEPNAGASGALVGGSSRVEEELADLIKRNSLVEVFDILPTAFVLNLSMASEMMRFKKCFSDLHIGKGLSLNSNIPEKHCKNNQWILKPAALNQGRGIGLFSKIRDIVNFLGEQPPDSQWVVQKYIERPLLYRKRKFDVRMWALVHIQDNPEHFDIYFFKEGYLRTSSREYDLDDEDLTTHLTNNCLQVLDKAAFGQHEVGNTVSFELFQKYLDEEYPDTGISIEEHFLPRMKDVVIDAILATRKNLNQKSRRFCFELLGYDFLIDEDFRVWLLEVNNNPFLGYQNDQQYKLL